MPKMGDTWNTHRLLRCLCEFDLRPVVNELPEFVCDNQGNENYLIFKKMKALTAAGKPLDWERVVASAGLEEVGMDHIREKMDMLDPIQDGDHDAFDAALDLLVEQAEAVTYSHYSVEINKAIEQGDTAKAAEMTAEMQERLLQLSSTGQDDYLISEPGANTQSVLEAFWNAETPLIIPTGIDEWDRSLGGLVTKGVTMLSANTGGGKSMVAMHMARTMAEHGRRAMYVSLEMENIELLLRDLVANSMHDDITMQGLMRKTISRELFEEAVNAQLQWEQGLPEGGALIRYKPKWTNATMEDILARAGLMDCDVLFIDHGGLVIRDEKAEDWKELLRHSEMLKRWSDDNNVPVVYLMQTNDKGEVAFSKNTENIMAAHVTWQRKAGTEAGPQVFKARKSRNTMAEELTIWVEPRWFRLYDVDKAPDSGGPVDTEAVRKAVTVKPKGKRKPGKRSGMKAIKEMKP